jgi:hypothetical protein
MSFLSGNIKILPKIHMEAQKTLNSQIKPEEQKQG